MPKGALDDGWLNYRAFHPNPQLGVLSSLDTRDRDVLRVRPLLSAGLPIASERGHGELTLLKLIGVR